nr:integrase, catalytic region, zinc finger, CCHC-type, peptidase aspartic, catalytic [Tanacetum cinerariifolium]
MPCVTRNDATPNVAACAKNEVNVQLIPPRQRNNRAVHHGYLNRLRDTLDTLHEIVEEASSKRPSDNNLDYACVTLTILRIIRKCNNPPKLVKQQTMQKMNIPILHYTRISNVTKARRSQPKSNTMHDRPLRVQSINGKKYIIVIVDDYSWFTWVKFLRSKDETPEFVVKPLKQLYVGLNKTRRHVYTDNGTEFVNKDISAYYESVSIIHEKTILRTPQ